MAALVGSVDGAESGADREFGESGSAVFLPGSAVEEGGYERFSGHWIYCDTIHPTIVRCVNLTAVVFSRSYGVSDCGIPSKRRKMCDVWMGHPLLFFSTLLLSLQVITGTLLTPLVPKTFR